jgi:hypothetical protein
VCLDFPTGWPTLSDLTFTAVFFLSVVARNNDILKKLVLEAKRLYEKDAEHRVHIFMADTLVHLPFMVISS